MHKGTRPNIDSYSAFFDNCKANDTGLTSLLEAHGGGAAAARTLS